MSLTYVIFVEIEIFSMYELVNAVFKLVFCIVNMIDA